MSEEGFKFHCPYCSQPMRAFEEHVGMWINCPTCDSEIEVPELGEAEIPEQTSEFVEADLEVLGEESQAIGKHLQAVGKQPGWLLTVVAELISARLQPMQAALFDSFTDPDELQVYEDPQAILNSINQYFDEFLEVFNDGYFLMTDGLTETLNAENLAACVDYANRFSLLIEKLARLYQELTNTQYPNESPYSDLYFIMMDWPPFCLQNFVEVVAQLQFMGVQSSKAVRTPRLDLSMVPTTVSHFCHLRQTLREDIQGADSLFATLNDE